MGIIPVWDSVFPQTNFQFMHKFNKYIIILLYA